MKSIKNAVLLLSLLTLGACGKKQEVTLETVTVSRGDLTETVTATGTLESVTSVSVGTQVTGIIDKLYADYNSVVKKGELIAEIEKTVLESDLRSAEANVASAEASFQYAKTNYSRDKKLHDKKLISDYEFQTSEKEYEVAKAAYDKSLADKVRAAKNLNYAEIYSPIDGIVISREVEVGQTVVSNMSVANLYTIADLDHMQVVGNVDEADIGQVKVGQRVTFTVDAYSDDTFEGTVTQVRLSPTTTNNVVTYEVIVATENPDHKLIPGLTATLSIYVTEAQNAITLPASAFAFAPQDFPDAKSLPAAGAPLNKNGLKDNQRTVWVVENNHLVNKAVTVGASNGVKTEVLAGLADGAVVATGYDEQGMQDEGESGDTQRSPFAPGPRNKKK